MDAKKLVVMANQIASFFETQRKNEAVSGITDHIKKFWDPRMRAAILAHLDAGGAGLDPPVRKALEVLKAKAVRHDDDRNCGGNAASHAP